MLIISFFCSCEESRIRSGFLYVFTKYCRRTYNNKGRKLEWTLTLCAGITYRRVNMHATLADAAWITIKRNVKSYSNKYSEGYIAMS